MSKESHRTPTWRWDELDPMPKGLVAVFSGAIGDKRRQITTQELVEAMRDELAFDIKAREIFRRSKAGGNFYSLQSVTTLQMQEGIDPDRIHSAVLKIADLAGGREIHLETADLVNSYIIGPDCMIAALHLNTLSGMAVDHVVQDSQRLNTTAPRNK